MTALDDVLVWIRWVVTNDILRNPSEWWLLWVSFAWLMFLWWHATREGR